MIMKKTGLAAMMITGALFAALPSAAGAQAIERTYGAPTSPIASLIEVPANAKIMFVSGTTPSPPDASKPDELGDTKAQTLSILTKMKASLEAKGYSMGDIVKMTVFLVGTPATGGRMDSAAMNEVAGRRSPCAVRHASLLLQDRRVVIESLARDLPVLDLVNRHFFELHGLPARRERDGALPLDHDQIAIDTDLAWTECRIARHSPPHLELLLERVDSRHRW